MPKNAPALSTREFSELTGISISVVSRLIREGKIKGVKISGKWSIDSGELNTDTVRSLTENLPDHVISASNRRVSRAETVQGEKEKKASSKPSLETLTVAEFSQLTYLTEKGVREYLKNGRLQGVRDDKGIWRLDSENLKNPGIRHLIR